MRTREAILKDLVCFNDNIAKLQLELSNYPWDVDNPIFTITSANVFYLLSKFENENTNFDIIEDWANAIECREDLDFENEKLKALINELANPILFKQINADRIKQLIKQLDDLGRLSD